MQTCDKRFEVRHSYAVEGEDIFLVYDLETQEELECFWLHEEAQEICDRLNNLLPSNARQSSF